MICTLGIDLASQDKNTAICSIQWVSGAVLVDVPMIGVGDETLIKEMAGADWVGIDAPFGWPDDFAAAVHGYAAHKAWPAHTSPVRMRYRATDAFVRDRLAEVGKKISPLSVSSDRIAACAWHCAALLSRFARERAWAFDRLGVPFANGIDGPPHKRRGDGLVAARGIVEVYPAAALAVWGLPFKGYKSATKTVDAPARVLREAILDGIRTGMDLDLPGAVVNAIVDSDHALDAFVSSLVAYAAAAGETHQPDVEQLGAARREGWIYFPYEDNLSTLG